MRHASVRVRWLVNDGQTNAGVGTQHYAVGWWTRIEAALIAGCAIEGLPLEIVEPDQTTV